MIANRRLTFLSAGGALLLAGLVAVPATRGSATEADLAPALTYDLSGTLTLAPAPVADADPAEVRSSSEPAIDADELECMAKVVMHEAGNQPRDGQLAVAQTLVNRMQSGRFAGSICGVANQRGQYFNTAAYRPARDSARWQAAVSVARDAMLGNADHVAPGAMFFRAAASTRTAFFQGRQHVATIGGHVFYR